MKFKRLWLYILTPLLVLLGSAALTNTVQAQELKNVITDVKVWDFDNGKVKEPNKDGVYELTVNKNYANYRYTVDFDLSNYNDKLVDGDFFTFTIPAPITVKAETFDITDAETKVNLASANVVSNGDGKGGKVTITLKNLNDYLTKKGGTQVKNVKGNFWVGFSVKEEKNETTVTYPTEETKDNISHKIKVKNPTTSDYGYEIGVTNYAKVGGIIEKTPWSSDILKKKGDYSHPFVVRVNDRQASYNVIEIHDYISADNAPAQFVPESLNIESGYYDNRYTFQDVKTMTQGTDYTIEWNESYTDFKIKISNASSKVASNGKPASYRITYKTTAPADGTRIANTVEVKGDDVPLKYRTDRTDTEVTVWRNSTVTSGGTIQLETGYRITLYKVDEKTQKRLVGAKFKITPPLGATATEETVTTNADGVAQSSVYSEDDVKKGNFTVTEVEAPKGYELDSTPFEVTVGKDGVIKTVKNKRTSAKAQLSAIKKLTGRVMKAGEFEFDLFDDKTGKVVETVTNDADGNINFAELSFDQEGEYTYHIVEKKANTTEKGVTYDANPVEVKVTVTTDATTGKLVAAVTYENDDKTFENTYAAEKTSASLEVTKKLTGRELKADEFEFVLKNDADGSELQKVKNTADGKVTFAPIEYTKAGTYNYTIVETNAGQTIDGVTYDNLEVKVTVEVTDDGEGKLHANVTYPADKEFNNSYGTSKAKAALEVTKKLTGRELKADEFEFTLTDQDGNVKETVKNDKDGNVKFSELEFDKAGTYTYKIDEKAGTATGIQYDTKTITATVTVADNGKGVLEATVAYDDEKAFENTYTPAGATSVTLGAKKVLEGKALEAGKYSFELKKEDGTVVETVTNAADGTVTFSPISYDESQVGTHKYIISEVAGSETGITYDKTVQEVEVTVEKVSATELKATASKEAKDLVFTNKYTPAKTEVPVKKVWNDKENQDGKRPTSITVKLLVDGQDTGKRLELSEANGWAGKFTELDADKGGTPIKYTVEETAVKGYTTEVTGDATTGFTITNSYTPETVDITATKNWDDANNQDGKRPTKITINLLADGQKVDSKEVQAAPDGTWTAKFEKLAKYKAGKEIKYTVTEEKVSEYESSITDFNITNKYTPKTIEYKVTKVWNDANNQDGRRPDSVTVQLYKQVGDADPVAVEGKKMTLTAKDKTDENTWVASFTNLPKYEAGKEIKYSIKEVDVPAGYKASVTGQVVTNTHTPEKPTPGKPNEPGKPGQKPQLPNTGEKVSNVAVVAGLALMAVTGGLYFVSRKNK